MSKTSRRPRGALLLLPLLACFFAACGGGSGTSSLPTSSQGVITAFGSVWVNGVEYDTSATTMEVDDHDGTEEELRRGMTVRLRGSRSGMQGQASALAADDAIDGPIASRDLATGSFVVLGRTISLDGATLIKDASPGRAQDEASPRLVLTDLSVGDLVEVWGFETGDGSILATRVERRAGSFQAGVTPVETRGIVSSFTPASTSFLLGSLTVDYGGAAIEGTLSEGVYVEVGGVVDGTYDQLSASRVEVEDRGPGAAEGDEVEVEGIVTRLVDSSDFDVNGQTVDASGARWMNGQDTDLVLHARVEVEGRLAGGILVAEKVVYKAQRVRLETSLEAVNVATSTIQVFGLTVHVNAMTRLRHGDTVLAIGDFTPGQAVRVHARIVAGSEILEATELRRTSLAPATEHVIKGLYDPDSAVSDQSFTVLGLVIDASATADGKFKEDDVGPVGRGAFFAALAPGVEVEGKGAWTGSALLADELEYEIDE